MKYARALVRMPTEFDGDHDSAGAASSHARRTAGPGAAGKAKTCQYRPPCAALSPHHPHPGPHQRGADVGQVVADGIGPQRFDLGVPGRFEALHELEEVREVLCSNRLAIL